MALRNGYQFLLESFPIEPYLRFKGGTIGDFLIWKDYTKKRILKLMGYDKLTPIPLSPRTISIEKKDTYTLKKLSINTTDALTMPFYILEPLERNGKAAIALHGHGCEGKEGLVGNVSVGTASTMEKYNYKYAFQLADKGYTVFIPDMIGAGERTLKNGRDRFADCDDINNALISFGMSMQGVILFENMRLVHYISKTFKDIVCCGFSGGGYAALWLAIMAERVSDTIVSGYFHSFKDTLLESNLCGCNFIPNLWKYVDMGDILALSIPKKVYIEVGDKDKLNGNRGLTGVYEQMNIANNCYKFYGKYMKVNVCKGAHRWYGSWLDKF